MCDECNTKQNSNKLNDEEFSNQEKCLCGCLGVKEADSLKNETSE